ncbi:hypothetical protein GGR57DRAFT_473979 [Xylariaceae sp. FL1272]|nr:hypothetical protein GGR57DRAFT_473979 [Xylariaceae sp. FL1272]
MLVSLPTQTAIPTPPPGPTYVIVEPTRLGLGLFATGSFFGIFVFIALILRVLSRFYISMKLGWDDILVFVASIISFGQTSTYGLLTFGGLGHVASTVPAPNQFSIPKILFSFEVLHIVGLNVAKLSALVFYLKLFNNDEIAKQTKRCIVAICIGTAGLFIYQFTFCHPLADMWKWDGLETCGDRKPLYVLVCVWSILTDLLLLIVPIPAIWKLKMDMRTRIRLSSLFGVGLSVTAVSIIRLGYIATINYHDDFSYYSVSATFLADLEPALTILCVSAPMIYTLFARLFKKSGTEVPSSNPHTRSYTYGSAFGRRVDPTKRNFNQITTTEPDPFEMDNVYSNRREIMISTTDKRSLAGRLKDQLSSKSLDADVEYSSGSEQGLVHEMPRGSPPQNGGIVVSTDFTVSVSRN